MSVIIDLSANDARQLLMLPSSYCNFELPPYFDIESLLKLAESVVKEDNSHRSGIDPNNLDGINYTLLVNKDNAYSWRPFQIVHPVIYAELVNLITEELNWNVIISRFKEFSSNQNIVSINIPQQPLESTTEKESNINRWWQDLEQESIRLSLEFKYLAVTDITDYYGSIYTHTISWALHTKKKSKNKKYRGKLLKDGGLLGNDIDKYMQYMHNRQTNGIPQGNMVSDLIAEIILGYADSELAQKLSEIGISDYRILRYRDDYRIFTQSQEDNNKILLNLTNILTGLNLKLNPAKTSVTDDIISASIRTDKLDWILSNKSSNGLQHELLKIREFSKRHKNSGSLVRIFSDFRKHLENIDKRPNQNNILISIVVDIMLNNPRIYPTAASVLAKLLSFEEPESQINTIDKIRRKFESIANIGNLDIWLQRINIKSNRDLMFDEPLCKLVNGKINTIWNSEWLSKSTIQKLLKVKFVNEDIIDKLDNIPSLKETESYIRKESPDMAIEVAYE